MSIRLSGEETVANGDRKTRILDAARELFAANGFDGNGIRDIAREARVSVSMVSYHYGGKLGVLRAIMSDFFEEYSRIVQAAVKEEQELEGKIGRLVAETTRFMKDRQDVFRIVVTELPHLPAEASGFEAQYLSLVRELMDEWLLPSIAVSPGASNGGVRDGKDGSSGERRGTDGNGRVSAAGDSSSAGGHCLDADALHRIVGPALLSMIYSTFLFGRGLEKAFCFTRDDAFFDEYTSLISRLIVAGIREVVPPDAVRGGAG
ncbi:MAG: TetR family transcriptional regulator [bacterium]